jgi:hypothetical protein
MAMASFFNQVPFPLQSRRMVDSVALILLDKLVPRPVVPNQVGVAERVPHLRRSHGRLHGTPGLEGQWLGVKWNSRSLGFARDDKVWRGTSMMNWLVAEESDRQPWASDRRRRGRPG